MIKVTARDVREFLKEIAIAVGVDKFFDALKKHAEGEVKRHAEPRGATETRVLVALQQLANGDSDDENGPYKTMLRRHRARQNMSRRTYDGKRYGLLSEANFVKVLTTIHETFESQPEIIQETYRRMALLNDEEFDGHIEILLNDTLEKVFSVMLETFKEVGIRLPDLLAAMDKAFEGPRRWSSNLPGAKTGGRPSFRSLRGLMGRV